MDDGKSDQSTGNDDEGAGWEGRVAVVTGGASGIGLALAHRFAAEGMRLVVADIEADALRRAERALRSEGAEVVSRVCDVSDAAAVEALADATYDAFGATHILCNNAGVVARHEAWGSLADWEWVLGVDLWGVIHGVRAFVPRMLEAGQDGHVMNTASTAGLLAFPGIASYNVAKRGVVALSETMHHELARTPLSVSVLCPGLVDTRIGASERNRPGAPPTDSSGGPTPDANETLEPAEVADLVVAGIRNGIFWILPHPHYGHQALEQAQRRVHGGSPVMPRIDR